MGTVGLKDYFNNKHIQDLHKDICRMQWTVKL